MLLPPSPSTANGWSAAHHFEPAGVVSGDYIDLVSQGDRLYFMVGDISGKGVASSVLMAAARDVSYAHPISAEAAGSASSPSPTPVARPR